MGSPFTIVFYDKDSTHAAKLASAAFALVDSFANIYSDYIDSSELNKLSRSAGSNKYMPVTPALYDILLQSQKAYAASKGAFDITIGPVVKLWRKARKEQKFPDSSSIKKAMNLVGFDKVKIDKHSKSILLEKAGMQLDLGGIAQGYIAQKILERLKQQSIKSILVDVSGDIILGDAPPGKKGWIIGVNLPEQTDILHNKKLVLSNCAVSTSGDIYQYIVHNGKKYSHIINPLTGYGVTSGSNVTVIANDATTADWLATSCSILSFRKAKRIARKMNAALMSAHINNTKAVIINATNNFQKHLVGE
jgi:thiamine biosynthesis lipoprotein